MSRPIIAGPFVGEFGWELFSWQGYLRGKAKRGQHVFVFCRRGNAYLYKDFAAAVVELDFESTQQNTLTHVGATPSALARENLHRFSAV
ncbi:unnamed protein product, partial [marine sediment metagenome]